jgi:hypothetical protein
VGLSVNWTTATQVQATGTVATDVIAVSPPGGCLMVILYVGNTIDPTSPATPTITDNLGAHLTYTLGDFSARADTPAADGQAASWTAFVPEGTTVPFNITITNQAASPNRHAAIRVGFATDPDGTPRVGAHGKSGSISAASIAQSYTAQGSGGQGVIAVVDWAAKGVETAGTGATIIDSANIGAPDISYGFARRTNNDDVNGGSNTINVTIPGTSTSLRWVYLEVLPGVGIPFVPTMYRRKPAALRLRSRDTTFSPPWSQVVVANPQISFAWDTRVRPNKPVRRGRVFEPPKPITISNPAFAIQATDTRVRPNKYFRRLRVFSPPINQAVVPSTVRTRRWFKPRSRQTEFVVTPTQVVVPTNPAITFVVDIRIRAGRMLRRARIFTTPIDQPEPPTVTARRRWLKPRVRQTEFLTPSPQAVAATNPTIAFTSLIRVRAGRMLRRARAFTPVPPQVVPPVNPTITFTSLIRIRVGRMIRRGRVAMPTPPQVVVTPTNPSITFVSLRRRLQVLLRKGRTFAPPIDQTGPPGAPTRRRFSILPKRSRVTRPVPSVEPPQAPKPPRRRFFGWLRRKPQAFKPTPPQVVVPNPNITFPVHPYRHYDKVFKHPRVFSPPLPQAIQKYPFVPDETITIQTGLHVTYVATQTVEIDISTGGRHDVATGIVVTNVQTA